MIKGLLISSSMLLMLAACSSTPKEEATEKEVVVEQEDTSVAEEQEKKLVEEKAQKELEEKKKTIYAKYYKTLSSLIRDLGINPDTDTKFVNGAGGGGLLYAELIDFNNDQLEELEKAIDSNLSQHRKKLINDQSEKLTNLESRIVKIENFYQDEKNQATARTSSLRRNSNLKLELGF